MLTRKSLYASTAQIMGDFPLYQRIQTIHKDENETEPITIKNKYTKLLKPTIAQIKEEKLKTDKVLLCGIGKLENNYIREWVEHYKSIGFDNICLFDNNDVDGEHFEDVIKDYIDSGFVILKDARGFYRYQIEAYNVCYEEYKNAYDWIAFFDIDEFLDLDSKYNSNVKNFLNEPMFNHCNCIRVCWQNYDDNDLYKVVDGNYNCKERFTRKWNAEYQTKAIIRTTFKHIYSKSPHILSSKIVFNSYNTEGKRCNNGISIFTKATTKNARLNHYRFKTIEEYILGKMIRLWPTDYGDGGKKILNVDFFWRFNKKTKEKEEYAKKLLKEQKPLIINSWIHFDKNKNIEHFNWGDELNYFFIKEISLKDINIFNKTKNINEENYQIIGSIITDQLLNKNTIIWGSGIPNNRRIIVKPKKVCAVRGPLSRKHLIENKIECPEVYGDPAMLLPLYYKPTIEKKYKYGIIPHWSSLNEKVIEKFKDNKDVLIIKMKNYNKWTDVIDQILSCENIISESLHGLIVAEAYSIPNIWMKIKFDTQTIKYHDFFLSLGKDVEKPFILNENVSIDDIEKWCKTYEKVNNLDLQKLIDACPFNLNLDKLKG